MLQHEYFILSDSEICLENWAFNNKERRLDQKTRRSFIFGTYFSLQTFVNVPHALGWDDLYHLFKFSFICYITVADKCTVVLSTNSVENTLFCVFSTLLVLKFSQL